MILRSIKMLGIGALAALLAQSAVGDTPWQRIEEGVWKKQIEASKATVRMALVGGRTHFAVTFPCGTKDGRTETYRWMAGEAIAKNKKPCPDSHPTIRAEEIMDLLLPFPWGYQPLMKPVADGLIV